ncbi:hypothetical protein DFH06DRAFT_42093 [Mycena polygramma]|nr:hypothetical protein DFH06DRAFT_42093 [Mycena polygramma]
MPTILQTWIGDSLARIGDHARNAFNSGGQCRDLKAAVESLGELNSSGEVIDPLSLAIAFVGCPRTCGAAGHLPTLLKHSCTRQDNVHWLHTRLYYGSGANNKDAFVGAAESVFHAGNRFTPSSLDFKSRLSALEAVVKAYERDPKTTTIQDMTAERRLLSCGICVDKAKDPRESSKPQIAPAPMDWLAAMHHSLKAHLTERDAKIEWMMSGEMRSSDVVV